MNPERQKSIRAIALFAAVADGTRHEREREDVRRVADTLATDAGPRQLTDEMAVCVCGAAGRQVPALRESVIVAVALAVGAIPEGRQAVIISAAFVLAIFDASPLAPGDVRASVLVGAIPLPASCKANGHAIVDLPSLPLRLRRVSVANE